MDGEWAAFRSIETVKKQNNKEKTPLSAMNMDNVCR
jgi:hypothetical protein